MMIVEKIANKFINKMVAKSRNEIGDILLGKLLSKLNNEKEKLGSLHEVEFKVFSQWGDDGIIQYLINKIQMPKNFVEFGVESYHEANTRFLLMNDNWSGLILDGSKENIENVHNQDI